MSTEEVVFTFGHGDNEKSVVFFVETDSTTEVDMAPCMDGQTWLIQEIIHLSHICQALEVVQTRDGFAALNWLMHLCESVGLRCFILQPGGLMVSDGETLAKLSLYCQAHYPIIRQCLTPPFNSCGSDTH